jgi:hypothetical protein
MVQRSQHPGVLQARNRVENKASAMIMLGDDVAVCVLLK